MGLKESKSSPCKPLSATVEAPSPQTLLATASDPAEKVLVSNPEGVDCSSTALPTNPGLSALLFACPLQEPMS